MLLRTVTFENFGIYGGVHAFDLTPDNAGPFDRPLVVFSGKNGVGKTTFVEGIRLCLHGPMALGSRVGEQEYAAYLAGRIHHGISHNAHAALQPDHAAVELAFDFTSLGKKLTYRVRREWAIPDRRLVHDLHIWENGEMLAGLTLDERETLLRDLVPVGLAEIFFFDGEKINALASEKGDPRLLTATVNALLGLNLVDQLHRDLDIYLTRHGTEGARNGAHHELEQLLAQEAALATRKHSLDEQVSDLRRQIDALRVEIGAQEAQIAAEGGSYAGRRAELLARRTHIDAEVEALHRQGTELANGLLPFAIAPELLRAVRRRLELENTFHAQAAAHQLLDRQEQVLAALLGDQAFWTDEAAQVAPSVRDQILLQVLANLRHATLGPAIPPTEVILHVSDKERAQLGHWIDQALAETPQAFSQVAQQIGALKAERAALEADLARVPADEVLAPLVERHHALLRQLGGLEQRQEQLQAEERSLVYGLEQNDFAQRRARAALEQSAATARRVELIARTQRALDDYKAALTQRKVALLEQSLVSHFNQLCRKQAFVDRISVDLETFAFTLHRAGHTFGREQLSAGENQLLAVATLWALRELSGRATPVIIDTPLSRLDSQHRHGMLHDFLPRASHQVILLATDAEIDAAAMKRLAPVIARVYRMEYDSATGAATHTEETLQVVMPNLMLFEEGLQRIRTGTDAEPAVA